MLWFWGLAGAFIYAGPRWVIALASKGVERHNTLFCTLEFLVALLVGMAAAAAFGPLASKVALTTLEVKDDNAVSALIGLLMNPAGPKLIEVASGTLTKGAETVDRVLGALKGEDK